MYDWYAAFSQFKDGWRQGNETVTLKKSFDFGQLVGIFKLPKVFRLLCELLALDQGISLMSDKVSCSAVKRRDEFRKIYIQRIWSIH